MSKPKPRVLTQDELVKYLEELEPLSGGPWKSWIEYAVDAIMALTFETRDIPETGLAGGTIDYSAAYGGATRHVLIIGESKPYDDAARRQDAEALAEWVSRLCNGSDGAVIAARILAHKEGE